MWKLVYNIVLQDLLISNSFDDFLVVFFVYCCCCMPKRYLSVWCCLLPPLGFPFCRRRAVIPRCPIDRNRRTWARPGWDAFAYIMSSPMWRINWTLWNHASSRVNVAVAVAVVTVVVVVVVVVVVAEDNSFCSHNRMLLGLRYWAGCYAMFPDAYLDAIGNPPIDACRSQVTCFLFFFFFTH